MAPRGRRTVAVTGASGFIGSHVTSALLKRGHTVRATVRDPDNAAKVQHLKDAAEGAKGSLELWKADLLLPGDFDECFAGCDAVVHCAAVVSNANAVKDPIKEIVDPSVKGTANVIESIRKAKTVKKVVHTSSVAAIQTYDKEPGYKFTEADWNTWSSPANGDYYGMAKVDAEKAMKEAGSDHGFEVVCINPVVVFGPCLTKAHTKASPVFVRQLIFGNTQPDAAFSFVDVRDVAEAHALALDKDGLDGRRFIISGDHDKHFTRFPALAQRLSALRPDIRFEAKLYGGIFYWIAWYFMMSEFEKNVIRCDIEFDNTASKNVLGLSYTDAEQTLQDTVTSMVDTGFVKAKPTRN